MSDEQFEEFLQREAKAYNEPPAATPSDEMWAAVSKAREVRRAASDAIVALPSHRPARGVLRHASWIGMAATLLIGVGIGRFALQRGGDVPAPDVQLASQGSQDPQGSASGEDAARSGQLAPGGDTSATTQGEGVAASPRGVTTDASSPARQVAATAALGAAQDAVRDATDNVASRAPNRMSNGAGAPTPYSVVSQRHLASAEALITVVTATPRDAMMDSLTTKWAREMLGSTRLLLDSPAGDDPLRRRLLEDLETLLVQLVQRSGGAVDERDLIDRTLQRTQLLTRLRTNATGT